jgi:hypothetical protein
MDRRLTEKVAVVARVTAVAVDLAHPRRPESPCSMPSTTTVGSTCWSTTWERSGSASTASSAQLPRHKRRRVRVGHADGANCIIDGGLIKTT